jgi:hypothetical protein
MALAAIACDQDSGAGKQEKDKRELRGQTVSEERIVPAFEGIVVPKKGVLEIRKGELGPARITGPKNYLAALKLRPEKRKVGEATIDVLVVDLPTRIVPPGPEIVLVTPNISYVEVAGGGTVDLGDFSNDSLTLRAADGGRIDIAPGAYGTVNATTSEAGSILAQKVMVEEAHLTSSGPSRLFLGQVARVKRNTKPPSRVSYQGQPEVLK